MRREAPFTRSGEIIGGRVENSSNEDVVERHRMYRKCYIGSVSHTVVLYSCGLPALYIFSNSVL